MRVAVPLLPARAARLAWRRWIWRLLARWTLRMCQPGSVARRSGLSGTRRRGGRARWARTRRVRTGLGVLPIPPSQILLNNPLYVSSQMAIPTDNVDPEQVALPSRWDVGLIRRFMLYFGPISSLFGFATFGSCSGPSTAAPHCSAPRPGLRHLNTVGKSARRRTAVPPVTSEPAPPAGRAATP